MSFADYPRSFDEILDSFRTNPECTQFVLDNYWDTATLAAAERFASSAEFGECFDRVAQVAWPAVVLDLGAGAGIATYAFLKRGARHVYALEPDPSPSVGRGAIARITKGMPCTILDCEGENIPLADGTVDVVYGRQVMHHARHLGLMARECARVLRGGGVMLVCREHVADNAQQKERFLADHALHRFTGAENAYSLQEYLDSLNRAGLAIRELIGPLGQHYQPLSEGPNARGCGAPSSGNPGQACGNPGCPLSEEFRGHLNGETPLASQACAGPTIQFLGHKGRRANAAFAKTHLIAGS